MLAAIDTMIAQQPKLARAEFSAGVYTLPNTRAQHHRCFDIIRDGFTLLAMGFTGPKALQFKLAYIAAFNELEQKVPGPSLTGLHQPGPRRPSVGRRGRES